MAYLDNTGLAYFWGKIKAWANSVFALLGHVHPSSDVTSLSGYSKPASGSAIASSDSLNQAVGKLEAKVDAALDDSNYVHKTGDEIVAGAKTFTASGIIVKNTSVAKGEVVSNDKHLSVQFFDKNNLNIGQVLARALSSGNTTIGLFCYDPTSSTSTPNTQLSIWWNKNEDPYALAPSTPVGKAGNVIITHDYIPKDTRIVHTTGSEVISGGKLFTGDMDIQSTAHAKGDAPSNDAYYNFWVCDKNATAGNTPVSTRFGGLELILYQDKTISTNLVSYVNSTSTTNSTVVGAISHADGNDGYGFVRNGYFQTFDSNGYIVNANFAKGSVPSYSFYHMLLKLQDSNKKNVGGLYHYYLTDKTNCVSLIAYNGTNGTDTSSDQEQLSVGYNSNGSVFTYAPTPASSSNDNNIATTSWVRSTISKSPTDFVRKYTNFTRNTAPSSNVSYWLIKGLDNGEHIVGGVYGGYATDKTLTVSLMAYQGTTTDYTHAYISVGYDSNGNRYTYAPTPATSSNDTNIATTAFVKNQDYVTRTTAQTITGTKTFSADIISNTGVFAKKPNNNTYLQLFGGADSTATTGGKLFLGGSSSSLQTGMGILQGGDSNGYRQLIVTPSRIKFNTDYCVFANNSTVGFIRDNKPDGRLVIYAGSQELDGAGIKLHGRTFADYQGRFNIIASKRTSWDDENNPYRMLTGTPDGSIYWNGQPIQTSSDERLKTEFDFVNDEILDNWDKVNWLQFKYKDAVKEKGENARFHVGLVAQRVDKVFADADTDIKKYGIICHEYEEARYVEATVIDAEAYTDTDGVFHEEVNHVEREFRPGQDEWTVRYTEALCMEAAYMRRENARLKKRIAGLEDRLAALELKIS